MESVICWYGGGEEEQDKGSRKLCTFVFVGSMCIFDSRLPFSTSVMHGCVNIELGRLFLTININIKIIIIFLVLLS